MRTYVLYDSLYGNTKKVAEAIGKAIGGEVKVAQVSNVDPAELKDLDLLIVGTPTHGGRPSSATQKFLKDIPSDSLKNIKVAAFDTRFSAEKKSCLAAASYECYQLCSSQDWESSKETGREFSRRA